MADVGKGPNFNQCCFYTLMMIAGNNYNQYCLTLIITVVDYPRRVFTYKSMGLHYETNLKSGNKTSKVKEKSYKNMQIP